MLKNLYSRIVVCKSAVDSPYIVGPASWCEVSRRSDEASCAIISSFPDIDMRLTGFSCTILFVDKIIVDPIVFVSWLFKLLSWDVVNICSSMDDPISKHGPKIFPSKFFVPIFLRRDISHICIITMEDFLVYFLNLDQIKYKNLEGVVFIYVKKVVRIIRPLRKFRYKDYINCLNQ